jgi:hypothetical protein
VFQDTASVLFDVKGLQVTDAGAGADGTLEVWGVTDHPAARVHVPGTFTARSCPVATDGLDGELARLQDRRLR